MNKHDSDEIIQFILSRHGLQDEDPTVAMFKIIKNNLEEMS